MIQIVFSGASNQRASFTAVSSVYQSNWVYIGSLIILLTVSFSLKKTPIPWRHFRCYFHFSMYFGCHAGCSKMTLWIILCRFAHWLAPVSRLWCAYTFYVPLVGCLLHLHWESEHSNITTRSTFRVQSLTFLQRSQGNEYGWHFQFIVDLQIIVYHKTLTYKRHFQRFSSVSCSGLSNMLADANLDHQAWMKCSTSRSKKEH